ncbi:hypothetical protein [Rudaea cellulosilytica]|uniref:hypothetical protein n=1 Tax=Rudaea cellulosilytica TaxID=540746 RepID=UPI0012FA605D|nr:hypothetical protein [Rudaea cellulosilytica]
MALTYKMQNFTIDWMAPWQAITAGQQALAIQRRLEHEITPAHRLFDKGATAIGLRRDNDDVVAVLSNGAFVNVHLVWGSEPEPFPDRYPDWFAYGTIESFITAM